MTFHEIRLPDDIERGASGGPGFLTDIVELASGFEQRNSRRSRSRAVYNIGYGLRSREDNEVIINFFYARRGRLIGFRFRDWSDFQIEALDGTPQVVGVGNGSDVQFQLRKTYQDIAGSFDRFILKPVDGTVRVFLDTVETTDFTLDIDTGVLSLNTAPAVGVFVQVTGEFDVPVRFDTDDLDIDVEFFQNQAVPSIDIIELLIEPTSLVNP